MCSPVERRLAGLRGLLEGEGARAAGLEGLLDLLICVHQECSAAPLRRERNVRQFLEWGESGGGGRGASGRVQSAEPSARQRRSFWQRALDVDGFAPKGEGREVIGGFARAGVGSPYFSPPRFCGKGSPPQGGSSLEESPSF